MGCTVTSGWVTDGYLSSNLRIFSMPARSLGNRLRNGLKSCTASRPDRKRCQRSDRPSYTAVMLAAQVQPRDFGAQEDAQAADLQAGGAGLRRRFLRCDFHPSLLLAAAAIAAWSGL